MDEGSKADQYRALAEECERLAAETRTRKDRDELLRKAAAYRALADNERWLNGQSEADHSRPA
jgi:hypothetical protein